MSDEFVTAREFVRGAARFADLCYILAKGKALMAQDVPHANVVGVDQGDWVDNVRARWNSTAIAVARKPEEKMVCVGEDGDVCTYVGGDTTRESLKPKPVLIRNARAIKGEVYACGMKRQVYRRTGEAQWVEMSAPAPGKSGKAGFEAIDGYNDEEMYAVGWAGEVWQYDGMQWINRASPTNLILTAVCCGGDGVVYAVGQQGTMLRGRRDSWELVPWDEEVSVDLWDLCWFRDKLYVAAINGLFTLEGNVLVPVDFGIVDTPSCFSLTTAEGVLWSIGRDDVLSFDGSTWQRYT